MNKDKILSLSIETWNESFVGISALDVSDRIDLCHSEVMSIMKELQMEGKGHINEDVLLYQVSFNSKSTINNRIIPESKPIHTHVFFPSKDILTEHFLANSKKYIDQGNYSKLIHKGGDQLELIYFEIDVLSKYSNKLEIYYLQDDVTGGTLKLSSHYLKDKNDSELDEIFFDKVWYGKRKQSNGHLSVCVMLIYLSKLPIKEQNYWSSFEIRDPLFITDDGDFYNFMSKAFRGEWVESNDPVEGLKSAFQSINYVLNLKVFKKIHNPYLKYPNTNTYKEFVDCNSELYKLIGPDNIDLSSLKRIFLDFCNGDKMDFFHEVSKRELSTLQVFELILNRINKNLCKEFKAHWNKIKDHRISGDHKITIPLSNDDLYIDIFRDICRQTNIIINDIAIEFQKLAK